VKLTNRINKLAEKVGHATRPEGPQDFRQRVEQMTDDELRARIAELEARAAPPAVTDPDAAHIRGMPDEELMRAIEAAKRKRRNPR
jgi:hypothetical protein